MADTKISDLAALAGTDLADTDLVSVVDVSDTTMAASGTNKKMTVTELAVGLQDELSIANTQVTGLGGAALLNVGTTAGTVAAGDDTRMSNARTPTAHASTHGNGQSDAITIDAGQIGSGTVGTARLGSGSASASTYLRGDQTWSTVAAGIAETLLDAKGDLIAASAADTAARLAVGTVDGQSLQVAAAAATGVAWRAPSSPRWWTAYESGVYYSAAIVGGLMSTGSVATGTVYYAPFYVVATASFDRFRFYTTTVSSGKARAAIYDSTGVRGLPGALVLDAGEVDTSGAAGDKDITISQSLTGGTWYWLAVQVSATTTISTYPIGIMPSHIMTSPAGGSHGPAYPFSTLTYGAYPSTATISGKTSTIAGVVLRAA